MLVINKTVSASPVDFAAEELKKYLRMMMPEGGDVKIVYNPEAQDGFRLGLMQDFGLDVSDVEDTQFDDILYIDTDAEGGIIAGDNPCAVLLAVYEYLRQNGCRWLYPGVDGEYIPMQDIKPVKYRFAPSCRTRSHCWEGAVSQQSILDMIDFAPKIGMNTYMLEHKDAPWYYQHYYNHLNNEENRPPEPLSQQTIIQYKRACEAEIAKRGLQFHNIGHGWTSDPFADDWETNKKYLAELDGVRDFYQGAPVYTNFCMSNPEARAKVVKHFVEYSLAHSNTDYMHIWLADLYNNHCECAECVKKTPSDWYMVLMNEIDEALTKAGLDTKVVFIVYVETTWPPVTERIKNPNRFTMLFAPIGRTYTATLPPTPSEIELKPYVRNKISLPDSLEENLAYYAEWKKVFPGAGVGFEYHFWRHQYFDPSGLEIAKRVYEDVKAYKENGLDGIIEDGTQRPFFPNGFAFYTFARTLFDTSLTLEEITEEYFSAVYGDDWRKFYAYLEELAAAFDFAYLSGEKSLDPEVSSYYNPPYAEALKKVEEITERGLALIREHYNSDRRVRTVSVRLLEYHAEYCRMLAKALIPKALGREEEAQKLYREMINEFGKREIAVERYYDHFLAMYTYQNVFKINNRTDKPVVV